MPTSHQLGRPDDNPRPGDREALVIVGRELNERYAAPIASLHTDDAFASAYLRVAGTDPEPAIVLGVAAVDAQDETTGQRASGSGGYWIEAYTGQEWSVYGRPYEQLRVADATEALAAILTRLQPELCSVAPRV